MSKQRVYVTSKASWVEQEQAVSKGFPYEPCGRVAVADHDGPDASGEGHTWPCLREGLCSDGDTALHRFRNRDFSPSLGRWVQQDPMGYVDGMSLYEYVGSSPTGRADPNGTDFIALGQRPVGTGPEGGVNTKLWQHLSLEYWSTSCDPPAGEHYDAGWFRKNAAKYGATLTDAVELVPDYGWSAWYSSVHIYPWGPSIPSSSWEVVDVMIGKIRSQDNAREFVVLATDREEVVAETWRLIQHAAETYPYGEQESNLTAGLSALKNWPQSLYHYEQNNCNTFVYWVMQQAGLNTQSISKLGGFHVDFEPPTPTQETRRLWGPVWRTGAPIPPHP